jgi:hypothetical protein
MAGQAGGHLPEELKELHDALINTDSVEQFLHEMAVLAARLVGGDLSCGMTMRSNGRPVTVACSDPVAATVDAVQYELDNGPCLHAMRDGHMVRIGPADPQHRIVLAGHDSHRPFIAGGRAASLDPGRTRRSASHHRVPDIVHGAIVPRKRLRRADQADLVLA